MENKKNILILTYWEWNDALIQTYTLPYARMIKKTIGSGQKVVLLTLEKGDLKKGSKNIDENPNFKNIQWKYVPFGFKAALRWLQYLIRLKRIIKSESITHIHCWGTPAGMIGYLLAKWTKRKLIIDSYEPHAEAMVENGTWAAHSRAFRILFRYEKKQTHLAQYLIAATEGMKSYAKDKYNYQGTNYFVKPACTDLNLFHKGLIKDPELVKEMGLENKLVVVYAGKFGGIYYDKDVFEFIKIAIHHFGDRIRFLLLTNTPDHQIQSWMKQFSISPGFILKKFVPHSEVPRYIALGDFALSPVKPVPTKRYCTPIKDGEYWALGLPVIIPENISDDSDIIAKNNAGIVIKAFNQEESIRAVQEMKKMLDSESDVTRRVRIMKLAVQYRSFGIAEKIYSQIYA